MNRHHHLHVLVFSFTLLMILLRPYAAYHIASRSGRMDNPVCVSELLQRLVTKKDERHMLSDNEFIAVQQPRTSRYLPVLLVLLAQKVLFAITANISSLMEVSYNRYMACFSRHYLRFAQLRI